jgi:hypothetical protein
MLNKDFKLIEKLNDLRNSLDIFSDLSYEERLNHGHYTKLLNEADRVAKELQEMKEYKKLEWLRD